MEPDNIERYDRQIRLWGQHGQCKCSSSKICLVNANSLGTEILRGLCLAGVGSFVILDSQKLSAEDFGSNFIPQSCLGKGRAESAKSILLDINEEVSGEIFPLEKYLPHVSHVKLDFESNDDVTQDLGFWKQFNCVVASGFLYIDQIVRLSKICWLLNVPLLLCKSIGFLGLMRCQLKEHLIIETHPDNALPNFYLDKPFRGLREYLEPINLEDDSELEKINSYPYIVIVYKYLKNWQASKGYPDDRLPNSFSEKRELKSLIDEGLRSVCKRGTKIRENPSEGILFENYIEASKAVNTCLNASSVLPDSVHAIFEHPMATGKSSQHVSRFWYIIRSIKEFVFKKNERRLPVSGTIPDMTSSSEEYIRLQSIYAKKAREDVDNVFGLVQNCVNTSSCSPGSSLYEETRLICKNIRDLRMVHSCPIYQDHDLKMCTMREDDEDDEFITICLCLTALDSFFSTYGRLPGCQDDQIETDVSKLKELVKQLVGKSANRLKTLDQTLYELCRYGGIELHATSAFMGGCIAQEVIKLVTNQYAPVEDTLVYNAMAASTKCFRFSDVFVRNP